MKKLFALSLLIAAALTARAQVFTTLYLPTAGSGLTLNLAAGRANCGGTMVSYSAGTLTMTGSTTNYVYLNAASSCVPAVKTTTFTSSDYPIAVVVTGVGSITSVTDERTYAIKPGAGVPGGSNGDIQVNNSGAFGAATSPQMVAAMNNTPSSMLDPALLPHASTSAYGAVKPDGVTTDISGGKLVAIGAAPSGAAGGDLGSTYPNPTVQGLKGVPFCTGFTPTTGQAVQYTTASSPNPCYTAATVASGTVYESRQLNSLPIEYGSCAGGAICPLASISGAGTMVSLDLAITSTACSASRVHIIADGVVVVSAPAGLIFGVYGQGPCGGGTAQLFGSPKETLTTATSGSYAGKIGWNINFKSSLVVVFQQDPAASASPVFSNVDYYSGAAPAGLYPSQWANFNSYWATQNVAQYATMNWLPTFSGAGALESVQFYASATNTGFVEGDPSVAADGGSYVYNGLEDLFCGNYGFAGLKGNISGSCGSAFVGTTNIGAFRFFDLLTTGTDSRPVPFSTSLALSWSNGTSGQGSAPGQAAVQTLVSWYTSSPAITPIYTGNSCQNVIAGASTTQTCVIKVLQAGDTVAGFLGSTAFSSATSTCGTVTTVRDIPWAGGAVHMTILEITNATAGSCTITLNYTSGTFTVSEFVDIANANTTSPIDNTNCTSSPFCSTTGMGATIGTAGAITTTGANELVLGFSIYGNNTTLSGGAGWNFVPQTTTGTSQTTDWLPAYATGAYTPTFVNAAGSSGSNWVTSTIAIKN